LAGVNPDGWTVWWVNGRVEGVSVWEEGLNIVLGLFGIYNIDATVLLGNKSL
jgi:hypothetical protein